MKKIFLIAILIVAGVMIWFVINNQPSNKKDNSVYCTQEAKQCPDGSYTGRTGPKCEFVCPEEQVKKEILEETTAFLNQKILNGGIYITPIQVVSDSRCPIDVQCIWAGEILIKVELKKGDVVREVELKEGGSVIFEDREISLMSVIPEKNTKNPTPQEDYQFIFNVVLATNL